MLRFLPAPLRGTLSLAVYTLNTLFWCSLLFPAALAKLAIPLKGWRKICSRLLERLVQSWVFCNNLNQRVFSDTRWEIEGDDALDPRGWYLVLANHRSWVDILVLQRVLHRRVPMLKFFLKKELIWVPVLGLAWWALEFPFMKRYSHQFLRKHPHLAGKDLEITRRACRKFSDTPVCIMNFVEGTRFSARKHLQQKSPHTHLLRAKAGGIALVLGAMGERLQAILDVTIVYPAGLRSFWQFVCGDVEKVSVRIRSLPVGRELIGDYAGDRGYRQRFQQWLNALWVDKDHCIDAILTRSGVPPVPAAPLPVQQVPGQAIALRLPHPRPVQRHSPPSEGF